MAKITNPETIEKQRELRQHIAMMIATLKAADMAMRRDYRNTVVNLAVETQDHAFQFEFMASEFKAAPNKEHMHDTTDRG